MAKKRARRFESNVPPRSQCFDRTHSTAARHDFSRAELILMRLNYSVFQ